MRAAEQEPESGTAMTLSTVSADGRPSSRVVLLKHLDDAGLVFYTNYTSRKALDLSAVPYAAVSFYWPSIERQVRVEGHVEKVSAEESDAYFESRPRESQVGAWASRQSDTLASAGDLEQRVNRIQERFADRRIPRPDFWGGYRLHPERIEFWRSRPGRLHERTLFERDGDGWSIRSLYP
jgi:pyridoxamine 5'-phosphate oxidase